MIFRRRVSWLPISILAVFFVSLPACRKDTGLQNSGERESSFTAEATSPTDTRVNDASQIGIRENERHRLVEVTIFGRGIKDEHVLEAMRRVPRHSFIPANGQDNAYSDHPVPIGHGQTISQPYIVAYMTELLEIEAGDKVLEVGTGSGYQAAVLAEIASQVYSIEIIEPLAVRARGLLDELGYTNIETRVGDGYFGWEEYAPFDGIIVTAAAGHVPPPLVEQLAPGGRIVIPVGNPYEVQILMLVMKKKDGTVYTELLDPVRFVPMTGTVQRGEAPNP